MTTLVALWQVSLLLCLAGALALVALIVVRLIALRLEQRRQRVHSHLLPLLLGSDASALEPVTGMQLSVAAQLSCELAELMRGSDREALLDRATALGVPALLERRLHARSAQKRLAAVEALSLFGQCGPQTRHALDDPNPDVRLGAALALAQREDAPHPAYLIKKLRIGREEHSLLLVSLMTDLVQRDPHAVVAILKNDDLPHEAKVAATDALADSGGQFVSLLAELAMQSDGEHDLQPRLYRALGRAGHPSAAKAIMAGLDSPEWPVRASASEAAGRSSLTDAADRLGELLEDSNWWVRYRASEALLRLGPRGMNVLWRASESDSPYATAAASAMLTERRVA